MPHSWRDFVREHHRKGKEGNPGYLFSEALRDAAPLYKSRLDTAHSNSKEHVKTLRKHAKHAKGEPRKNLESVADINEQRAYGRLLGNMGFNGGEARHNRGLILEHFSKS
jgi:hypothetical protein